MHRTWMKKEVVEGGKEIIGRNREWKKKKQKNRRK
jgi:hypothetical protein